MPEFYRCSECGNLMSEDKKTCGRCSPKTSKKKSVKKKAKK